MVVLKGIPSVRVAGLAGIAASYGPDDIGPVIRQLYPELFRRLEAAGTPPAGPEIAWYEAVPGGRGQVIVQAAVPVAAGPQPGQGVLIADLPAVRWAATLLHHGSMDNVIGSLWVLAGWIEDHGYRMVGYHREVYLDYCPEAAESGVTELQLPVARWLAREMNGQAGLLALLRGRAARWGGSTVNEDREHDGREGARIRVAAAAGRVQLALPP